MKNKKKIFLSVFITALTFLIGGSFVKADDTFTYGGLIKESTYAISYHTGGSNPSLRYLLKSGDATTQYKVYCSEESEHTLAQSTQAYTKTVLNNDTLRAILTSSYPYITLTDMSNAVQTYVRASVAGQSEATITLTEDEAVTGIQAAIWKAQDTNKNYTDTDCTNCKYVYDYLLTLNDLAASNGSITFTIVTQTYAYDTNAKDFVLTLEYKINSSDVTNVTHTLTANNTNVTSNVSTLSNGNYQYVGHYPLTKTSISYTINASGTDTVKTLYQYTADVTGTNYQDLIGLEATSKSKSATNTLTPALATLVISKIDGLTNELLAGATFTLKDSSENEIDTWTSSASLGHTITNVVPGTYTLTETTSPEGYQALSEPVTIEVTEITTYEIDVDNEEIVIVDKTDNDKSLAYYFIGGAMLFTGISITATSKKKKHNN